MTGATQLTLTGEEVSYVLSRRTPRLGQTQRDVLRALALDQLTSAELNARIPGGARAVRRLRDRGMAEKHFGLWFVSRGWE